MKKLTLVLMVLALSACGKSEQQSSSTVSYGSVADCDAASTSYSNKLKEYSLFTLNSKTLSANTLTDMFGSAPIKVDTKAKTASSPALTLNVFNINDGKGNSCGTFNAIYTTDGNKVYSAASNNEYK